MVLLSQMDPRIREDDGGVRLPRPAMAGLAMTDC